MSTSKYPIDNIMYAKTFVMIRDKRICAYGVVFPNKQCVVNWEGDQHSIVIWDTFDMMMKVNGHFGTRIHFDKKNRDNEDQIIQSLTADLNNIGE